MAVHIVTGMWGPRRAEYAGMFLPDFDARWPAGVRLVVVADPAEQSFGALVASHMRRPGREARVAWMKDCPGWADFMDRHGGDPVKCGKAANQPRPWKPSAVQARYNFRFDACRFAGQSFAPERAAERMEDGDILVWLDADVVAHSDVPAGFIEGLVGEADGAFLGRGDKHSEIGFWAVRLNDRTRAFLAHFASYYRTDGLFSLKEWHSAYVWDAARRQREASGLLRMIDLTPGGSGHVWHQSPLRHYLDHLKGDRKAMGRSPERRA